MLRIAVVGANATGLYLSDLLMSCKRPMHIDLIDQAPAPAGLAPYGKGKPSASTVRFIGNVPADTELDSLYDLVLDTNFQVEIEAKARVSKAIFSTSGNLSDPLKALQARGIATTTWLGGLNLPAGYSLAQWHALLATATGAPVCF
ncbi:hypothetical protein [Corynebacterium pseudopelargi]|uniref:Uncharacterized protein n=1 Tax=Corynebacterium pseudopelargi TaxID=2080757 RepID=A0A3G6IS00_9CORY|nr:hypothetical protein [Corynebacterium pseudopelargi]AZA08375.1 hypothetical protein CPPEL_01140 [Corynebacterium pseudopelargi]